MVTFSTEDTAQDKAFCAEYFHLYHRLRRIADRLIGLYLCGDMNIIVPDNYTAEHVPRIVGVAFDERAAQRYERRAERLVSVMRGYRQMPPPDFCVRLTIAFPDGAREDFPLDLSADDVAVEFCRAVCERARIRFRNRFSVQNLNRTECPEEI